MAFLNNPLARLVLSLALLAAIAPVVVWFFRRTWVELDNSEAAAARRSRQGEHRLDPRVPVTFLLGALSLLFINEYGSRDVFDSSVLPVLRRWARKYPESLDVGTYQDLYWRVYWGVSRYAGYLMPLLI